MRAQNRMAGESAQCVTFLSFLGAAEGRELGMTKRRKLRTGKERYSAAGGAW
jgi:hypothetical protein